MKRRNRLPSPLGFPAFGWRTLALVLLSVAVAGSGCGGEGEATSGDGTASDTTAQAENNAKGDKGDEDKDKAEAKKVEAVPVDVAVLDRGPIEAVIRASANLEAERSVAVLAEAARRVVERRVEEGDVVRKGDLLLRLQDEEQRSALARAETELSKAQREYDRQKSLFERDLTTEQALNDATDELERRKLAFEDAKRELGYAQVRAPISGTITSRMVNLGDHVQIGQHLFDIVDFESIVARIFVPEKNLKQLRPNLTARVRATAVRDEPFAGSVKRIAPVVDPRTGTIKVTVDVGGYAQLRPGLYVDVELVTEVHENALLVPKRALVYDNDQVFVYRLQPDRTVTRLRLDPVLANRDWIEPLGSALAPGDSVVIAGQAGLKQGARVRLPDEPAADEAAEPPSLDDSQVSAQPDGE